LQHPRCSGIRRWERNTQIQIPFLFIADTGRPISLRISNLAFFRAEHPNSAAAGKFNVDCRIYDEASHRLLLAAAAYTVSLVKRQSVLTSWSFLGSAEGDDDQPAFQRAVHRTSLLRNYRALAFRERQRDGTAQFSAASG